MAASGVAASGVAGVPRGQHRWLPCRRSPATRRPAVPAEVRRISRDAVTLAEVGIWCPTPAAPRTRRGANYWAEEGYGGDLGRQRELVVRTLLESMLAGQTEALAGHLRLFAHNPRTLQELVRDLALTFTYADSLRPSLPLVWREVMVAVLDEVDSGADLRADRSWSGYAIASLIPTPQLTSADSDPDATLARARNNWPAPDEIGDLVERWLPIAHGEAKAADAVAQLARCASTEWQVSTGLVWVERVMGDDADQIAKHC